MRNYKDDIRNKEITLESILAIIYKNKILIFILGIIFGLMAYMYMIFQNKTYYEYTAFINCPCILEHKQIGSWEVVLKNDIGYKENNCKIKYIGIENGSYIIKIVFIGDNKNNLETFSKNYLSNTLKYINKQVDSYIKYKLLLREINFINFDTNSIKEIENTSNGNLQALNEIIGYTSNTNYDNKIRAFVENNTQIEEKLQYENKSRIIFIAVILGIIFGIFIVICKYIHKII